MRLGETHENQKDYCGCMRLVRLIETHKDSRESGRLLGTHETQKHYCGLMRLMRIIETHGDS